MYFHPQSLHDLHNLFLELKNGMKKTSGSHSDKDLKCSICKKNICAFFADTLLLAGTEVWEIPKRTMCTRHIICQYICSYMKICQAIKASCLTLILYEHNWWFAHMQLIVLWMCSVNIWSWSAVTNLLVHAELLSLIDYFITHQIDT
jgi:hypothetical protein